MPVRVSFFLWRRALPLSCYASGSRSTLSETEWKDLERAALLSKQIGGGIARVRDVSITLLCHRVGKRVQQGRSSQQSRKAGGGDGAGARREHQQDEKPKKTPSPHVLQRSKQRLLDYQQRMRNKLYASCKLRSVLWRAVRRIRFERLWRVHNEWTADIVATYAIDDTPMADEVTTAPLSALALQACVAMASNGIPTMSAACRGRRLQQAFQQAIQRLRWMRQTVFHHMWECHHVEPAMCGRRSPGPEPELGPLRWPDPREFAVAHDQAHNWEHMAPEIRNFRFGAPSCKKRARKA